MGADFSEIHVQPVNNVAQIGCGDADEGLEQGVGGRSDSPETTPGGKALKFYSNVGDPPFIDDMAAVEVKFLKVNHACIV